MWHRHGCSLFHHFIVPLASIPLHNYWPLIPLGFVALWLVLCFAVSRLGWRTVAGRYPSRAWSEEVSGTELRARGKG